MSSVSTACAERASERKSESERDTERAREKARARESESERKSKRKKNRKRKSESSGYARALRRSFMSLGVHNVYLCLDRNSCKIFIFEM